MGITLTNLKESGTTPWEIEKLMIVSKGVDTMHLIIFRIFVEMLNGPVDLVEFKWVISSSISNFVIGLK